MRWSQPILIPVLVFIAVAAMLTVVTRQLQNLQEEVRHTEEVRDELSSLLGVLQEAESGSRGYLLTGSALFLEPYNRAVVEIPKDLDNLKKLTSDNPRQQKSLEQLHTVATTRVAQLDAAINSFKAGDLPIVVGAMQTGRGPQTMAELRKVIGEMTAVEDELLIQRRRNVGLTAAYLQLFAYVLMFVVMTAAIFSLSQARRRRDELESAQAALRATNEKLGAEIIERAKVEDQLRQVQKMEAIGQLTGGIAHDFNNMLAVIIGALNIMQRRIEKGDMNIGPFVQAAIDGAMRGGSLTQRLLAFARKQVLEPRPVDANKLVSGMSDLLRRTLGETIQTEVILAGGLWRIYADAHQLETVILNLVVNARDAMPEGGKLTIETANTHLDEGYVGRHTDIPPGQFVLLCISDTGTGMSPEIMAKAFDPFFTTKSAGRGTGLGLSQVYGFVKQSGGHVRIYSEPDQGATVKIYMPRYHGSGDDVIVHKAVDITTLPKGRGSETILVVEDEDAVRALTVEGLKDLGYNVVDAAGAEDALELLDRHPGITLLFTDIVMPNVNGRQLADEAVKRRPGLKVLYTTGYTRNAVVHNGTLDPGVRLLGKPFTLDMLARTVRDIIDGR